MALPVRDQLKYWGITATVFILVLWFLGDVILPFVVGGAIAYAFDPLADRLERLGASRTVSTSIISLVALLVFILMALLIIPLIAGQAIELFEAAPERIEQLRVFLAERVPSLADEGSTIRQSLSSAGETLRDWGGKLVQGVFQSALGVINAAIFIVVVPVVAFYLLLDWDNMVARIDKL